MLRERVTKVQLVEEQLRREIEIGNFARGTALPPERELAEQFGVSYMTMRKAVGGLIEEGLLRRNRGSGTFVCNNISEEKVQKKLGFVIPAWSAPENLDFIMYISEACAAASWLVKIIYARSWEERTILDLWQNSDALVCVSVNDLRTLTDSLRERIRNRTKPIVFCDSDASAYGADSIFYLPDSSLEEAAELLYRLGHRRIVRIDQKTKSEGLFHPGLRGFRDFFHAEHPDVLVDETSFTFEIPHFELAHHTIHRELVAHREILMQYTAVICPLSFYWGVMAGIYDAGLRVPEDLSVFTLGERQEARFYRPRPAALSLRLRDQMFQALELVRWRTEHPEAPVRTLRTQTELIRGETLAAARPVAAANWDEKAGSGPMIQSSLCNAEI